MGKHSLSDTHTNNFIEFKNRLSKARKGIGMTQAKVCESINLSNRSTLSNFESKKMERLPSLDEFVDLCDLYNVDPNYLLGFDEVRNFTVKTCCDELKLDENAVITIMKNKMAPILVNELFSGDSYAEIERKEGTQLIINVDYKGVYGLGEKFDAVNQLSPALLYPDWSCFSADITPPLFHWTTQKIHLSVF